MKKSEKQLVMKDKFRKEVSICIGQNELQEKLFFIKIHDNNIFKSFEEKSSYEWYITGSADYWEGVWMFIMKKASEPRMDSDISSVDVATGSPVIEIGYKHLAVPDKVDMVTWQQTGVVPRS